MTDFYGLYLIIYSFYILFVNYQVYIYTSHSTQNYQPTH